MNLFQDPEFGEERKRNAHQLILRDAADGVIEGILRLHPDLAEFDRWADTYYDLTPVHTHPED